MAAAAITDGRRQPVGQGSMFSCLSQGSVATVGGSPSRLPLSPGRISGRGRPARDYRRFSPRRAGPRPARR